MSYSYPTIMINLALGRSNEACLSVARDLAGQFEARVIGIAASEFSPPLYFTSGEAAQKMIDHGEESIETSLSKLEEKFRVVMRGLSAPIEWRSSREIPARYVAREARAADIIVTGQIRGGASSDSFALADPGDLIMQVGRPMLCVPDSVRWLDLRSGLVAWKDTAEARRVIVDALPMLRRVKEVTIAEIVEEGVDASTVRTRVRDVAAWLKRHGVSASDLVATQNGSVAEQLQQIATNIGAGVIVAGAYGHSRLREWILGGVTRQLLQDSDRCSLISR